MNVVMQEVNETLKDDDIAYAPVFLNPILIRLGDKLGNFPAKQKKEQVFN
jgi:hypothetical protein